MKKLIIQIIILIAITAFSAFSQETVYPSGSNILSSYSISETEVSIADTLIITRAIANNESFNLENLYFSENIPSELEVVGYDVTINGTSISYYLPEPQADYLIDGYDTYYWVIASPIASEGANNVINPSDRVELEIKIISNTPGAFTLPLHTTVFSGNGAEYFSTSSEVEIEFLLSVDIGDNNDDTNKQLPNYLIGCAYPNPFNSAVKIWYSGSDRIRDQVCLDIYDILGRKIYFHQYPVGSNQGEIVWIPDNQTGTGIYFYRLSSGSENYNGKIILLK